MPDLLPHLGTAGRLRDIRGAVDDEGPAVVQIDDGGAGTPSVGDRLRTQEVQVLGDLEDFVGIRRPDPRAAGRIDHVGRFTQIDDEPTPAQGLAGYRPVGEERVAEPDGRDRSPAEVGVLMVTFYLPEPVSLLSMSVCFCAWRHPPERTDLESQNIVLSFADVSGTA